MLLPKRRADPDNGLRRILHSHLPHLHWVTIETAATASGVPDSNCCWRGREFWVEAKATDGWAVHIRPLQIGWHLRRTRAGGRTFIAVRRACSAGLRREAADELWLFDGAAVADLARGGLRAVAPLGVWHGGPGKWNWKEIEEVLINGKAGEVSKAARQKSPHRRHVSN